MLLLDTDVVIWMLRNYKPLITKLSTIYPSESRVLSTVTIAEIYQNILPTEFSDTEEFINQHEIIVVSIEIAKTAGLYWNQYHRRLKNLGIIDCIIAATAKIHQAKLITLNAKHFPMKDIAIVKPVPKLKV